MNPSTEWSCLQQIKERHHLPGLILYASTIIFSIFSLPHFCYLIYERDEQNPINALRIPSYTQSFI